MTRTPCFTKSDGRWQLHTSDFLLVTTLGHFNDIYVDFIAHDIRENPAKNITVVRTAETFSLAKAMKKGHVGVR
jgi:hypothetical protein